MTIVVVLVCPMQVGRVVVKDLYMVVIWLVGGHFFLGAW